jgi:hypothetical protein
MAQEQQIPQGQNVPPQGGQIQVKITDEILKGVYSNMLQASHNKEEFVLDFMNILPPSGIINSRVIVSPGHMKRILTALQENVKRYEEQFGKIDEGPGPGQNFGFRTE